MNNTQYTQGPQGIQGPPGPQGPIGPQGPRGERGPQGERGNDGFNGMRGQRGPVGPQGPQGAPGSQGIAGPIGPQGPRGEKGDRGQDGVNGVRGPMGPQGPKGQDGTVSFNDLTDAQRESLRGPQGIEGPRGLKGDRGEIGPRGEQGIQGEAGPQGPKGQDGTVTFESLSQEQRDSLKGDRGERGEQGPRGERGLQGIQGPRGEQGAEGSKEGLFNHPEGRATDADEMKVNGYTITDRNTENLPGEAQGDARNGILKFMVQDGPTVKGSRSVNTTGVQIYTQTCTGESYTRNKIKGRWGNWKKVLMDGDVPKLPTDLMTHDKMRDYHDTHIKDVFATRIGVMDALKGKADKTALDWLSNNTSISFESLEGGNSSKNGGFLKLGLYGIEWRNNQKAGSAGHSSAATVSFTKLQTVYTVQACITGTTTGTVTFRKRDGVTYEYWGSNGNVWFNTFAIGLAK